MGNLSKHHSGYCSATSLYIVCTSQRNLDIKMLTFIQEGVSMHHSFSTSIELYDRDYTLLQYMWKPFKWCLGLWSFFRKSRNENTKTAKENIISVFATFNIMAYSKIMYNYCALLSTTKIIKGDGTVNPLLKNYKEP